MIASPDEIKIKLQHRFELQFRGTESLAWWLGLPDGAQSFFAYKCESLPDVGRQIGRASRQTRARRIAQCRFFKS
jgi:hypothetical protein